MYLVKKGAERVEEFGLRETAIEYAKKLSSTNAGEFVVVDKDKVAYGKALDGQFDWADHIFVRQGVTRKQEGAPSKPVRRNAVPSQSTTGQLAVGMIVRHSKRISMMDDGRRFWVDQVDLVNGLVDLSEAPHGKLWKSQWAFNFEEVT